MAEPLNHSLPGALQVVTQHETNPISKPERLEKPGTL